MLVLNDSQKILVVRLSHEIERLSLQLLGYTVKQRVCRIRSERLFEYASRVIQTALRNYFLRETQLVELVEYLLDDLDGVILHTRKLHGDRLNIVVRQMLVYRGSVLRSH